MNHLIVSILSLLRKSHLFTTLFLLAISFSIIDTNDPKKVIIVVDYDDGSPVDKLLVNRQELVNHDKIWKVIDQIITKRENNK